MYVFIYCWLSWVFAAAHRLPLVAVSSGFSCCPAPPLEHSGFSSCSRRAQQMLNSDSRTPQASIVVAPGLAAPWQVGSSQTRDPAHVLRIGMRIPNLWTPREVLKMNFLRLYFLMTCLEFDLKYLKKKGEREEER